MHNRFQCSVGWSGRHEDSWGISIEVRPRRSGRCEEAHKMPPGKRSPRSGNQRQSYKGETFQGGGHS